MTKIRRVIFVFGFFVAVGLSGCRTVPKPPDTSGDYDIDLNGDADPGRLQQ